MPQAQKNCEYPASEVRLLNRLRHARSHQHRTSREEVPEQEATFSRLHSAAAKEPIAASYSAPGVLAEAAHKTGRAKADFELREISKEEYERLKSLVL